MAQNTRNSDLSQIAVNANNIPDGGCRRAWFIFLICAINTFLPPPSLQTVSTAALSDWAGAVAPPARNMPDCAPSLWCSSPPASCRAPANYTSGYRPSRPLSSSATTPCSWVSKLQPSQTRSTYRKNASGCRPQHAETSEWGWGFPDREVYQFCDIVYDSNNVCVCASVCECVCHQIQALAGTSKCVIITIIGQVKRESLKRIRFRLLRNVIVFSCRSHEYLLYILYVCLRALPFPLR